MFSVTRTMPLSLLLTTRWLVLSWTAWRRRGSLLTFSSHTSNITRLPVSLPLLFSGKLVTVDNDLTVSPRHNNDCLVHNDDNDDQWALCQSPGSRDTAAERHRVTIEQCIDYKLCLLIFTYLHCLVNLDWIVSTRSCRPHCRTHTMCDLCCFGLSWSLENWSVTVAHHVSIWNMYCEQYYNL